MEHEVRSRLGETVFGADDETIEKILFQLLSDLGYTIGTAESMTGGLVAARLTDLPGSSAVMKGGLVAYHPELKQRLLGVGDVDEVVNEETAMAMAVGARKLLDVDVAVAVTGSAGPEALEKPAGTVIIGVATPDSGPRTGDSVHRGPGAGARLRDHRRPPSHPSGVDRAMVDSVGRVFAAVPLPAEVRLALDDKLQQHDFPGRWRRPRTGISPFASWATSMRSRTSGSWPSSTTADLGQGFGWRWVGWEPSPIRSGRRCSGWRDSRGEMSWVSLRLTAEEAAQAAGLQPEERPVPTSSHSQSDPPPGRRERTDRGVW